MQNNKYSRIVVFTGRLTKYFAYTLFGFGGICVLSLLLGVPSVAFFLMSSTGAWLWRLGTLIITLIVTTIFIESIRS